MPKNRITTPLKNFIKIGESLIYKVTAWCYTVDMRDTPSLSPPCGRREGMRLRPQGRNSHKKTSPPQGAKGRADYLDSCLCHNNDSLFLKINDQVIVNYDNTCSESWCNMPLKRTLRRNCIFLADNAKNILDELLVFLEKRKEVDIVSTEKLV